MTVSMFLEAMAGKCAALIGCKFDATPFRYEPDKPAHEYFSKILMDLGYNYQGNETFYSGITGKPLETQVFTGIVYYQRLRHMVSDKWQVRAEGPIDILTKQPVAGRKNNGAVRFGEMERDALLSHGCTQALRDRMFVNSDKREMEVCLRCESVISTTTYREKKSHFFKKEVICRQCGESDMVKTTELPYSFYMMCCQLAAMNIRVKLSFGPSFKLKDVKIYEY